MFPRYPEHLWAFDYVGEHRYFLTFSTEGRRRWDSRRRSIIDCGSDMDTSAS